MVTTQSPSAAFAIPSHVPPHLVQDFDFFRHLEEAGGRVWDRIGGMHARLPRLFWARRVGHMPGMWIATHAADQRRVLQDYETFSSVNIIALSAMLGETWKMLPIEADPPLHSKYRAHLNPLFAPKRVMALEGAVRATAVRLIERFAARGRCDFNSEFAELFPIEIFLNLMGWPLANAADFVSWAQGLMKGKELEEMLPPLRKIDAFLRGEIQKRRDNASDDITSLVLKMDVDGRAFTDEEALGTLFTVFLGGLDTVTSSLGHHYLYLATHPQEQQRLRENPTAIPAAVEELLRVRAVANTKRTVTKDTELAGTQLRAGDNVLCSMSLGNLDSQERENPEEIRLDRGDNRHLAFGYGSHRCVGASLARRELTIGMEEMLKRLPTFRIAAGTTPKTVIGTVFAVQDLHLEWDA